MVGKKKSGGHLTGGIFGAVGLISVLTLLSRVVGFGRWLSQSAWVGTGAFASAYSTANQIPTVLFEVVAGGALAGITIPLLVGPIARKEKELVNQITSALICWSLVLLVPVGVVVFLAAPWIAQVMPSPVGADRATQVQLITDFLRVFSVQVPLYGLCVVLTGVCQAHERFFWPSLAPLLSSLVVITTYALFGFLVPQVSDYSAPSQMALSLLAWGTTAGVGALSLPLFFPVFRLGVHLTWTLHLGSDRGRQALRLGLAGIGALIAQQVSVITVMVVIRAYGAPGSLPVYQYAQAVYTLPYAVLAVPIATAVFPRLSALLERKNEASATGVLAASSHRTLPRVTAQFATECALSTRVVTLAGILGAALLVAEAPAVTAIFAKINPVPGMMVGLLCLGPGIIGYGLIYHISRVLYALGGAKEAVVGASTGWLTVAVSSWFLAASLVTPTGDRAVQILCAIGLAQSLGMTVSGGLLMLAIRKLVGESALQGIMRRGGSALLLAAVGGGLGWSFTHWWVSHWGAVWSVFLAAIVTVFICVIFVAPVFYLEIRGFRGRSAAVK